MTTVYPLLVEAMQVEEIYKDLFHSFSSYSHREERILVIPPAIWEKNACLFWSM